jgi:hypothetical protein
LSVTVKLREAARTLDGSQTSGDLIGGLLLI